MTRWGAPLGWNAQDEQSRAVTPDQLGGQHLVPNPLSEGGALADGQTLTVAVAVVVPEDDLDTLQFSVETLEGVSLYYGVPR